MKCFVTSITTFLFISFSDTSYVSLFLSPNLKLYPFSFRLTVSHSTRHGEPSSPHQALISQGLQLRDPPYSSCAKAKSKVESTCVAGPDREQSPTYRQIQQSSSRLTAVASNPTGFCSHCPFPH